MKKRLLSLALALVMVFSLLPINAFALGKTTILSQPTSVTVQMGETAEFTITAINTKAEAPLQYIWYDNSKVDDEKLLYTKSIDEFLALFDGAKLGTGSKLTITNAQETISIRCVVYWEGTLFSKAVAKDVEKSNLVTLTVKAACASHVLGQNLFEVPAVEATCAHEGNIAYYKCNVCGHCYTDANAVYATTEDACKLAKLTTHKMPLTYHEATAGTCGSRSMAEYWSCDECGDVFKDAEGTAPTTLANLIRDGKTDPNNHPADKVTYKEHTDPTCSKKGNFEYWFCDECNTYFKDADLKTKYAKPSDTEIAKDASKHPELVEHKYTPATCEQPGNLPYYECTGCGKYFVNSDGTGEYSKESDVTIAKLGHNYAWIEFTEGDTVYHAQECSRCRERTNVGTHSGGTANCQSPAVCSTCRFAYGEKDPNNHVNRETRGAVEATITDPGYSGDVHCADCGVLLETGHKTDKLCKHTDSGYNVVIHHDAVEATCADAADKHQGNVEYWECTECGKCWTDSELTQEVTKDDIVLAYQQHYTNIFGSYVANANLQRWGSDVNYHWNECKYCGYVYSDTKALHNMVEKTHTCHSGDTCLVCGYDDRQLDPHNHDGGTEVRYATEPTLLKPGYTGDTYCLGCGEKLASGHEYYSPCSGGCKDLKKIEGTPATCTEDGTKTYYECTKCHNYYMDENANVAATDERIVDKCTGHDLHPTLNVLSDVSISSLKNMLGNLDYARIVKDIVANGGSVNVDNILKYVHIKDIDHCSDDEHHWLGCQRCGKTLADIKPELEGKGIIISQTWYDISEKQAHSGGTATCKQKAVCTECGDAYGSLADHRYNEDNVCTVCGNTLAACEAPTLTISTSNGVVLSWNAVEGAASYQVYRTTGSNTDFDKIATVTGTTYKDTSAVVGTKYYYKVRAIGTNGSYGKFSYEKAAKAKCAAPVVTAGNNASTGKITLKWKAVKGASKYEVHRATSKTGTYNKLYTTTGTSMTNTSANPGYSYYYKVRAIDKNGVKSNFSKIVDCTCKCAAPVVKATNVASTGKIKLTWSDVTGAAKYEIYRATSKTGNYTKIYTTTGTSLTNTSTTPGKTYYYKIKAISARTNKADSEFSAVAYRTCDCARPNVKITLSNGHPKLTWAAVIGADKYIVYRATSKTGKYTKITTTTGRSYINSNAKSGRTYYYKVVAVSNLSTGANSAYSSVVSIKAK